MYGSIIFNYIKTGNSRITKFGILITCHLKTERESFPIISVNLEDRCVSKSSEYNQLILLTVIRILSYIFKRMRNSGRWSLLRKYFSFKLEISIPKYVDFSQIVIACNSDGGSLIQTVIHRAKREN